MAHTYDSPTRHEMSASASMVARDGASSAPCRAHRSAGRRAGRLAGQPAARPVRRGAGAGAGARRGAVAEPAALARPGRRPRRRRGVRGGGVPQPGLADRRDHRHGRRRPLVTRRHDVAAAGGHRLPPRRAVVPHPGNASGPLRRPTTRPSCGGAAGIRWRDGWPGCSPRTPGSVRSCWSTGWTATRQTSTPTWLGSRNCGGRWSTRIDADPPHIRHQKTVARLREGPSDLPARLSLFGHTRLACTDIELLDALATHHDLHLWLPHPSDELWQSARRHPRRDPAAARTPADALLGIRCWRRSGRDLRELQRSLPTATGHRRIPRPAPTAPDTLLGWLQSDIAANAVRPHGRKLTDRRPIRSGAQLPRPGPADRRAARGAARPAGRRPDAGAARHRGDVPGHRDLCAADRRRLRAR